MGKIPCLETFIIHKMAYLLHKPLLEQKHPYIWKQLFCDRQLQVSIQQCSTDMYRHSQIANYLSTYCCPCSILTRPFEKHQKSRVIHKNLDLKQLLRTAAQCVLENILPSHILQVKIALRTTSDADDAANLTQLLHITM